jgi:4-hydroxybutyrate CoA-transferase
MSWRGVYKERLTSAEDAVKAIKSGDRVVFGHACGEPKLTVDAMVERAEELENVEVVHMVSYGKGEYTHPGMEKHFRYNGLFIGPSTRKAVNEGRADYTPRFFHEVPSLLKEMSVDVILMQVSPPDKLGYCSCGISVDYTKPVAEDVAKTVIAEVNPQMPRTLGDSFIHLLDINHIVECNYLPYALPEPKISPIEEDIGKNVASLIENGATLQLGIGAIPDAILHFLDDKKDLGMHTEMFSSGVIKLVEEGVITCKKKSLHRGKMVATFFMGTKELYDFLDDNSFVEMHPVSYTNDPFVISKNYKMTSINSFIQTDLVGNVNSETLGPNQYSSVGGQVDFVRGAIRSEGGKAILVGKSVAGKGENKVSKIVPYLDKGASVTTSRNDVQYIVTEYGIANLRGKTCKERAKTLINIAHPDFQDYLRDEARMMNLV